MAKLKPPKHWLLRVYEDSGIKEELEKELGAMGLRMVQDIMADLKSNLPPRAAPLYELLDFAPIQEEPIDPDDPYAVLGLIPGVHDDMIHAMYRVLTKRYHPDIGGDDAKFKKVQKVYETLMPKGASSE